MKTNYNIIICMFTLAFVASTTVTTFGLDDKNPGTQAMVDKVNKINEDIKKIVKIQMKYYKSANNAMSDSSELYQKYAADVNQSNTEFNDILSNYKPENVTWAGFDPIRQNKIDISDPAALGVFLDNAREVKSDLKGNVMGLKYLVNYIKQDKGTDTSSYDAASYPRPASKTTTYRTYRYSYPSYSYSYPSYGYSYPSYGYSYPSYRYGRSYYGYPRYYRGYGYYPGYYGGYYGSGYYGTGVGVGIGGVGVSIGL